MDIITMPMFRYGEADFDREYVHWGLHPAETQIAEAASVLRILQPAAPLRILDLACGIGRHAVEWAKAGHQVTAVDLSETFIGEGKKLAEEAAVVVDWQIRDLNTLIVNTPFDAVVWIEPSFMGEEVLRSIHSYLRPSGYFVMDVRNPENPRCQQRNSNWRNWREEDGVFHLERHELDPRTGLYHDEWIEVDTVHDRATRKTDGGQKRLSHAQKPDLIRHTGFAEVTLLTIEGQRFDGGPEPYWLWLVARR